MKSSVPTWVCRAIWLILPITLGEVFAQGLQGRSVMSEVVWQVFLWTAWALVLGASFVQLPGTLTFIRIVMPAAAAMGAIFLLGASVDRSLGIPGLIGTGLAIGVAILVMSGDVGADFIDGPSYGDERRLGLRPPGFLLIGPLQLLWLLTAAPTVIAVMLFASKMWIASGAVAMVAVAAAWYGFRLLNRLSLRCLVLVPAGLTLVDALALAEPTLFRREDIIRLGPAPVDSSAFDLSVGSSGLIISADFARPLSIVPAASRGAAAESVEVSGILLALSRPGQLLDLSEERRITVERR